MLTFRQQVAGIARVWSDKAKGRRLYVPCLIILIVFGAVRIAATHSVFSQTYDEPYHIASGMEWLSRGTFHYDLEHPRLAEAAEALGLWLKGLRTIGYPDNWTEGNALLYAGDDLQRNLSLARLGNLPFFVLCAIGVYCWARRLFGAPAALMSAFLIVNVPPVLGHAGLATTDMAITATYVVALFLFTRWLDHPSVQSSAYAGVALGLMLLSKFSCILFFPAAGLVVFALRFWGRHPGSKSYPRIRKRAVAVLITTFLLVTWAGYRFSFHPLPPTKTVQVLRDRIGDSTPARRVVLALTTLPLPAPELASGIHVLLRHARDGHSSYLLGQVRSKGWWYFFPVVLAVKTPLPFLLLSILGIVLSVRTFVPTKDWRKLVPGASAVALLLVSLPSTINLGVRHILPIYPLLAIAGGYGLVRLWESRILASAGKVVAICLPLWLFVESIAAHPDYLAYFNQLAGSHPERVLAESDLDWGQDVNRLRSALDRLKVPKFSRSVFSTVDFGRHHLPPSADLLPGRPATGWIAVSYHYLQFCPRSYAWLSAYPWQPIGKSIRLYWVDVASMPGGTIEDESASMCEH